MWQKRKKLVQSRTARKIAQGEKELYHAKAGEALNAFWRSQERLEFKLGECSPKVSIILILYNKASLTLRCLRSLMEASSPPFELIIVDNASKDETSKLLNRIDGAVIVRNTSNEGFLLACNAAARKARGKHLLFLNNDTIVFPKAIAEAVKTQESDGRIGAVGARIINLDGKLQEAGSIIWKNGECQGYGRLDDPFFGAYMYQREIDYGSGAFLLTPRDLFEDMGGFDEDYRPAYYEDSDYCTRLRKRALKIVYEPFSVIYHCEFGSATPDFSPFGLMAEHQKIFQNKHREFLENNQLDRERDSVWKARDSRRNRKNVLFIDDRVPYAILGSGFPRAKEILRELHGSNSLVTFFPTLVFNDPWESVYAEFPRDLEVILGLGLGRMEQFLVARKGCFDVVLVSRPHNMKGLKATLSRHPEVFKNVKIIYDAEAVFTNRERIYYNEFVATSTPKGRFKSFLRNLQIDLDFKREMDLANGVSVVLSVSEHEKSQFEKHSGSEVMVLGHSIKKITAPECAQEFSERRDFLFLGAIHGHPTPNSDSVIWFAKEVFPRIQQKLGTEVLFKVAGINQSPEVSKLESSSVRILGPIQDLDEVFSQARVFVAPTRFAAGIPHKVHEAASRGLPSVISHLLCEQLGWTHGVEVLSASVKNTDEYADFCVRLYQDKDLWKKIQAAALQRVQSDCAPEQFSRTLRRALGF